MYLCNIHDFANIGLVAKTTFLWIMWILVEERFLAPEEAFLFFQRKLLLRKKETSEITLLSFLFIYIKCKHIRLRMGLFFMNYASDIQNF